MRDPMEVLGIKRPTIRMLQTVRKSDKDSMLILAAPHVA